MENILKLYTYVDGVNDTPFPSEEEQVQIIDFKFDASRMAGAPTIEATVKHRLCLDNLWSDKVYASYRGEKYYVKNTPSSSKDNTDERYSHDVELMSERDVLNHVYFIDAVQGDSGIDKVKSNSPSVQFYGDIKEFVGRLNSSLEYAKLDYTAVIDDGIESEIVNVSFEDKYILEALQESFNIFEIPYYFVGKTIHFGYMENAIPYEMEYGNEGALLSISKENANYKAVNRVSGTGSTENIPYYYPNTSPNGDVYCEPIAGNTGITSSSDITVINPELFASKISVNDVLTCFLFDAAITSNNTKSTIEGIEVVKIDEVVDLKINVSSPGYVSLNISYLPNIVIDSPLLFTYTSNPKVTLAGSSVDVLSFDGDTITFMAKEAGEYSVHFETTTTLITDKYMELKVTVDVSIKGLGFQLVKEGDNVEVYNEKEIGLSFNKQPNSGDKIKQSVKALIPFSQTLMPPVYRETIGAERFYNAKNDTYEIPVEGGYYNFENEYSDNNRKEIIVDFSEIKPSIVGMTNKEGLRIDIFSEFAFDQNDSNEYDSVNNEYLHPYFYGKLRKFDGDYGFNLFDHAQEGSTITVAMTSGVCGGCNFEIGVGEETGKNIIQVDGNGDLIYGEDGKVKTGEPQEKQNDTRTNEVWIALKKDDTTYPSFKPMPNATGNLKPSAGDTFVLTGINMPQSYIEKAENDLKEAIIKYMWINNTDKFNFSIKFSRIFLKEHPEILDKLNENARIVVKYNNSTYTFYVDNFSVNVNSSEPLPEIEVNLVDTLTIGKNSLQNALDSVKQDILFTIGGADFLKQGLNYFIRKDVDDYANGKLRLKKGASFGSYEKGKKGSNIDEEGYSEFEEVTSREGIKSSNLLWGALGAGFGLVTKDSTGNSYLEIDKLLVRMKAVFNQLEIRELSYSGGNFIFSPAGMKCTRVVKTGNVYRCFFKADDGEVAVNNTFKVDDLVRMQEINIKEGVHEGISNRYFWRKCVGVGDNYIDLSMTDRDMTSDDAPKAGDSLVTLGNKTQVDRQNAIVISVFGEGSPSFIQYQGINDYTLDGKAVTTISPNGNVFTGDFIMKSGNKVEDELDKTNQSVDQAIQDMADTINLVNELKQNIGNLQDQIDGVIETWFYDPVPTLSNEPAVNWTTDNDKNNHLGDLYFDKDGKAYRFENKDGVYQWTVIPDTGLEEALRKAQQAQDTADGKRRIFTDQPTTESTYDVGDLWVNATAGSFTNDILRCKVAKTSGQAFSLSHWELASKYTDDTKANEAMQSAEDAQAAADAAQAAADKAQNTANTAKTTAEAANSELNKINSDGYISPSEKGALVQQQKDIQSEYADIISQANKYGVSTASYTTAYNSANSALTKYTATSPTHIEVGADYANIAAYYTARQTILDAISTAAKKVATDAQAAADSAKDVAEQAKQDAATAQAAANAAQAAADKAQTDATNAKNAADAASKAVSDLEANIEGAFADGIISEAEAIAISKYTNQVNESFTSINATYTEVYGNVYLEGTAKTNLKTKYDALVTKKNALLNAISTAIADGKATQAESQAVDTAFTAYNSAVNSYQTALEQANEAIQTKIKSYADAAQKDATKALQDAADAKAKADAAAADAKDANDRLNSWASDSVISPTEKQAIKNEQTQVRAEKNEIVADARKYSIATTTYVNAFTAYDAVLTKYSASSPENITIGTDFNSTQTTYYAERTKILGLIADGAKKYVDDISIGMVNLLMESNVEKSNLSYSIGNYAMSAPTISGKEYTVVLCYTLGENNTSIGFYTHNNGEVDAYFRTKGERVVESVTFKDVHVSNISWVYQFPNGTYGSKVHWAVLVEGNKGPNSWIPSQYDLNKPLEEYKTEVTSQFEKTDERIIQSVTETKTYTDSAIGNIKIGSVNLISKKMMLAWNEKNPNIAVWGQDADGVYLGIAQSLLRNAFRVDGVSQDIFSNKIKYKANTQYVLSISWRLAGKQDYTGLIISIDYTDGTTSKVGLMPSDTTLHRSNIKSSKDKTIKSITCSYGTGTYRSLIYAISLIEGNQIPTEIPEAVEDITGQSNVNLVDGGREITPRHGSFATLNIPKLKPNTCYTVSFSKAVVTSGDDPSGYEFRLYFGHQISSANTSVKIPYGKKSGLLITTNKEIEKEGWLLFYGGIQSEGLDRDITYHDIMLVEGFVPPSSYSPSAGDVQAEIDDVKSALEDLNTTIDTTFKDGIIEESEAKAIESNINLLNSEKADIDAQYTKLYANTYLTGTAKTNLSSAKSAYNTAHSNLINAINTAIADGKATEAEKNNVDSKFTAYSTALSTYKTRVEEANKAIQDTIKNVGDDAQATADLAQQAAEAAQESANAAKTAADTAQSTANTAKTTAEAANSELSKMNNDGYISPSEKSMLKQQQKDIQTEYNDIISQAGKYSIATSSYTTAYNSANSALTKYTAASPTHITVGSDYANISAYYTARQTILNSISTAAKKVATDAQAAADAAQSDANKALEGIGLEGGRMLYKDPTFTTGYNNISRYNNGISTGTVTVNRIEKPSDAPSKSTHALEVKSYGKPSPGFGGFYWGTTSRANAVFITKIIAKIPTGMSLAFASNATGNVRKEKWLTSNKGTGKYETYLFKLTCGSTGTFSSTNYFYLTGSGSFTEASPLLWYLAYATVFDMTDDGYGDLVSVAVEKTIAGINNEPGKVTVFATKQQYNNQQELISQLDSSITVQAGRIDSVVSDISGLNTRISQTESDIELKVDASGIISAINLSKEGVAIKGDRIEITGQTVFKDSNGNEVNIFGQGDKVLTVNNGVFSVDEKGLINASAGKIAGFEIDEDNFRIKANSVVNGESVEMYLSNYKFYMGSSKRAVIMGVLDSGTGYGKNTVLVADSGDIYQQGVVQEGTSSRHCRFYTSDLYLRMMSSHRQQLNGTWCPVVYPLAAGQQYVGDIDSNTNVAINIGKNVGTANYVVVGSWYTTSGGTANNNVLFVVTRKSTTDFTIAVTETKGTKQSVYFMWALFPI